MFYYNIMLKYIVVLVVAILCLLYFTTYAAKKEHFYRGTVAVDPNQFIQSSNSNYGNNLNHQMSANFLPDNLNLSVFFEFDKKNAKFFPNSNRIVNNFNQVPRVI